MSVSLPRDDAARKRRSDNARGRPTFESRRYPGGNPLAVIADLEVVSLEFAIPPALAYGTSRGLNHRRQSPLIKLTTDAGIVGYGEALGPVQPHRAYLDLLKPHFIGKRLYDFDVISAWVRNRLYHFGDGHFTGCLGALDMAVLDAKGKTLGLPVHDLIGGKRVDRVPCYATTGYITKDGMAGLERQLAQVDKSSFSGVKIKIGLGVRSDVERVQYARRVLGGDLLLMVDVNGNYTVDEALQSLRAIEKFDIHWVEEPLPAHDIAGHAELRARSPISIATGEGMSGVHDFKRLVDARGVDIVQPALGRCGGIGEARHIAGLAAAAGLRMAPAVWGGAYAIAAGLHFMTSLPIYPHTDNPPWPMMLEFDIAENPLRDDVVTENLRPVDGAVAVPAGPGFGLTLDPEKVEKYRSR